MCMPVMQSLMAVFLYVLQFLKLVESTSHSFFQEEFSKDFLIHNFVINTIISD